MIFLNGELRVARARASSTRLFQQHQKEKSELRSLDRIRILRSIWQLVSLFPSQKTLVQAGFLTPSRSSSGNTPKILDCQVRLQVISADGRNKASFSGTPYYVAKRVSLFLAIGMNGDTSPVKSSHGSLIEGLSLLCLEMSQLETKASSILATIALSEHPIQAHEALELVKLHSQGHVSSAPSTPGSEKSGEDQ